MGSVTILVLSVLCLGMFLVAGAFFNLWQDRQKSLLELRREHKELLHRHQTICDERDELLRQKQRLTENPRTAQDRPKVMNSAQARLRVDQSNASFWSADRTRPNSEVLKENSNG